MQKPGVGLRKLSTFIWEMLPIAAQHHALSSCRQPLITRTGYHAVNAGLKGKLLKVWLYYSPGNIYGEESVNNQ